ncbi:MAG: type II toxin-antitoxin system RelE/ParE family toxin, partial [Bacteroidetes bacterium]
MNKINFEIDLLPDATDFLENLDNKTREKKYFNIKKAQITNDIELFKKLNDNIWEFRTLYNNKAYRLFSFWDTTSKQKTLVIATHGIIGSILKSVYEENQKYHFRDRLKSLFFLSKLTNGV